MSLLNVALPMVLSSHPQFAFLNKENQIHGGQVRVPSLKRDSYLRVKCSLKGVTYFPPLVNGSIPDTILQSDPVTRKDFPVDFKFGASSSALQTEGAGDEGGRGPSPWDQFIQDGSGIKRIAIDSYHRYPEDVKMAKDMGADVYRISISWSRILPKGTLKGGINEEGINFYHKFIHELQENGIEPFITLFHFDIPQALVDEYDGFMSPKIVDDYKDYVELCFQRFGYKVKHWITINEPQTYAHFGTLGSSSPNLHPLTDPFHIVHNILLAHATAVRLYKEKYQPTQGGEIGLTMVCEWFEPYSDTLLDQDAARRAFDFYVGWILWPLVYGDYPFIMKAMLKDILPVFTDEQKELLKGSYDFIAFNYYTSRYAKSIPINPGDKITSFNQFEYVDLLAERDGHYIGDLTPGNSAGYIYPKGLKEALIYVHKHFKNPKIYITENGYAEKRDDSLLLDEALQDNARIKFMHGHLHALREALRNGVNIKGYFVWSMLDCMEMQHGYTVRYGMNFIDYLDNLKRYPKKSAEWFCNFNKKN